MTWRQLLIDTDASRAPALSDALTELGALSITLSDVEDEPVFEPALGTEPLWRHTRVTALFDATADTAGIIDALVKTFGSELRDRARVEHLEDRPWERAWMQDFVPMRFGARLWICPSWTAPPDPTAVNLLMDPGLAFGTGTHPTTALCLEWLDAHPPVNHVVVDYGCGSGILSVAAALLGASQVYAVDNDPQALLATRENAQRNGIQGRVSTHLPEQIPSIIADVVLANILANPLRELAPAFARMVRGGGALVLSGIMTSQAADVTDAYAGEFDFVTPRQRGEWVRLDATRRKD